MPDLEKEKEKRREEEGGNTDGAMSRSTTFAM